MQLKIIGHDLGLRWSILFPRFLSFLVRRVLWVVTSTVRHSVSPL